MQHEQGWFIWRLVTLLLGCLLILCPLCLPLIELLRTPSAWKVWAEWDRMLELVGNTILVAGGSSLLAIVLGGVTALLLVRTTVNGRWSWGLLLSVGLFIPLPMLLSGWYLIAQTFGASMPALWPVESRLLGTIFLHGLLGVPWAVMILSVGLLWIEPELEEEMLLSACFSRVFYRIILPRCWPFIGMAVLVVSWPAWHEIAVTDFFKVRTLAEEVYLQLNDGSMEEAPRAVAAILPWCVLLMMLAIWCMQWWRRACPPNWPSNTRQRRYSLGRLQPLGQLWLLLVISVLLIIPCIGLVMRAGMEYSANSGPTWSLMLLVQRLGSVMSKQLGMLMQSLGLAAITGVFTAATVLILIWLARGSERLESLFWWLAALLWAIPGPILGLGLLSVIQWLIQGPGGAFWSSWLYSEPSPVPNIWSAWLRFLPLAWLALWPMARLLPRQWDEAAWLDGASPWRQLVVLYLPRLWRPALVLALGIGLLTLGEISASKLVTTPGYLPLSHHLFQQLHAGADTEVAALSLLLLLPSLVCAGGLVAWMTVTGYIKRRQRQ